MLLLPASLASAAGNTQGGVVPLMDWTGNSGMSNFQEVNPAKPGTERGRLISTVSYNPVTTPVDIYGNVAVTSGRIGLVEKFDIRSVNTNTRLAGPVTVDLSFNAAGMTLPGWAYPWVTRTAVKIGGKSYLLFSSFVESPYPTGIGVGGPGLAQKGKVILVNPRTGKIVKTTFFNQKATTGPINLFESSVQDANGDGSDELVLVYQKNVSFTPTLTGSKGRDKVTTKLINPLTGAVLKQYVDYRYWKTN
ncbi:MAG: hypothetical protein D6698_13445 [Gammaproteobacteria bacterium]|nr:MAG: hypothetical protein D6698_13445 [Gammaproteobacteria bacterium]